MCGRLNVSSLSLSSLIHRQLEILFILPYKGMRDKLLSQWIKSDAG